MTRLDKIIYGNEEFVLGIGAVEKLEKYSYTTVSLEIFIRVLDFLKKLRDLDFKGIDVIVTENEGILVLGAIDEKSKKATGILIAPYDDHKHRQIRTKNE